MSRELLFQALQAVETARNSAASSEIRDRLDELASHLQSQAERDATRGRNPVIVLRRSPDSDLPNDSSG